MRRQLPKTRSRKTTSRLRSRPRTSRSRKNSSENNPQLRRLWVLAAGISCAFVAIIIRLGQWQLIKAEVLEKSAETQYSRTRTNAGRRGTLFTADGTPLVTNQHMYRLFAHPHLITDEPKQIADTLAETIVEAEDTAGDSAEAELAAHFQSQLEKDTKWVGLTQELTEATKKKIEEHNIYGIGFDPYLKRFYPEASLAAHLVGFVGKTSTGDDVGYFGVEGALEAELKARSTKKTVLTDAVGRELFPDYTNENILSGRDVYLTIEKDVQFIVEQQLEKAMLQYGARSGEVIVLDPQTGKLLAHATAPVYNPDSFQDYDAALYKNPTLANLYEPGSTFKILTVAAGIDTQKITPQTPCSRCAGPRVIDKYTIKTWNDVYNPNIDMEMGLAKSDNTAMIFITDLIGENTLIEYIKKFGIGEPVGVELQEDGDTPLPQHIGPVELATISFGQGIVTNSFQMTKAVAAIANNGMLVEPTIIEKIYDPATDTTITQQPKEVRQVISPDSARTVTEMMITAANHGEAQWVATDEYLVAGKTGTSQIAVKGGYDEDRTIASFVGFAPAFDPDYVMMVKLVEPSSSPWAAETAAPLWYDISDRLRIAFSLKE